MSHPGKVLFYVKKKHIFRIMQGLGGFNFCEYFLKISLDDDMKPSIIQIQMTEELTSFG